MMTFPGTVRSPSFSSLLRALRMSYPLLRFLMVSRAPVWVLTVALSLGSTGCSLTDAVDIDTSATGQSSVVLVNSDVVNTFAGAVQLYRGTIQSVAMSLSEHALETGPRCKF